MEDGPRTQQHVRGLRREIRGLDYLIRMDRIDPLDQNNELVATRMRLQAELDTILTLVRHEKEAVRAGVVVAGRETVGEAIASDGGDQCPCSSGS